MDSSEQEEQEHTTTRFLGIWAKNEEETWMEHYCVESVDSVVRQGFGGGISAGKERDRT